jgi:hypothetical protein
LIRVLAPGEYPAFSRLALDCDFVFASPAWLQAVKPTVCGIFDKGQRLTGGFLISERVVLGRHIIRTPLYLPSIGPFLRVDASNPVKVLETRRHSLSEMAQFLEARRPLAQHLALDRSVSDVLPLIWSGYKATPGYTYVLGLEAGAEQLLRDMSPKRRSELRKAEKDGIRVEETRDVGLVSTLVGRTFARQNKQYPAKLLEDLLGGLSGEQNWFAVKGVVNDHVASVALCVSSSNTAYYLFGGYDNAVKSSQAGPAVIWKSIMMAIERDLKWFDFEGSMNPNIERFYSDFGGNLHHYFRVSKAPYFIECMLKWKWRDSF